MAHLPKGQGVFLPPFKAWLASNIPAVYDNTMTYYEELCALIKYLQDIVVPALNNNAAAITTISTAVEQLQKYVDNYFKNLDVQEEINNKLDEMVEDGTMEALVAAAVQSSYLYDEITVTKYLDSETNTHYWITHVPHLDKNGNLIAIKHGLSGDNASSTLTDTETPRDFAKRSGATICINASVYGTHDGDSNYHHVVGCLIKDGALISDYGRENSYGTSNLATLGVKADNTLKVYPYGTTYEQLISDGVVNTFCAFEQVVVNGVITTEFSNYHYQWNLIGQNSETKDIYIFDCNGKDLYGEEGLTLPNACQKLVDVGCDFVYRLDQGGSTCLCENAVMLNDPTDDYGTTVRKTCDFLYFGKEPTSEFDHSIQTANAQRSDADLRAKINRANITYLETIDNNRITFKSPNLRHETTSLSGINLRYEENGVARTTLVVDSSDRRKQLGIYDNENSKTIMFSNNINPELQIGANDNDDRINIKGTTTGNSTIKVSDKSIIFNDHQIALWDSNTSSTKIRLDATEKTISLGGTLLANFLGEVTQIAAGTSPNDVDQSGVYHMAYDAESPATGAPYTVPYFLFNIKAWNDQRFQMALPMTSAFTNGTVKIKCRIKTGENWQAWTNIG